LSSIQTEKSKLLSVIQDNPHSEHSQRIEDEQFLQKVHPKAPIAWPKTGGSVAWESLDSAVYSRLVGSNVPLIECVDLLETTIHDQAAILLGDMST